MSLRNVGSGRVLRLGASLIDDASGANRGDLGRLKALLESNTPLIDAGSVGAGLAFGLQLTENRRWEKDERFQERGTEWLLS